MKTLLLASVLALSAGPAAAAVMTFDNLPGAFASPFLTYSENGFTFTRTSGYATKASIGDPSAPAVVSYGFGVNFDLTAGGDSFVFEGFGLFVQTGNVTAYDIVGLRGGATVFSYSATQIPNFSSRFTFQPSQSTALVDKVTMTFNNNGGRVEGHSTIDNISATIINGGTGAVPEPASWALMIAGFGMTGAALRSTRRRSVPTA